jgi:hypothetical protein
VSVHAPVVFIFFFFLFGLRSGRGREESDLFAVRRPFERLYVPFSLRQRRPFAAVRGENMNLFEIPSVRKEGELFSVRRPTGRVFGLRRIRELPQRACLYFKNPDVSRARRSFRRLGDDKRQPLSVRRKFEFRNRPKLERLLGRQCHSAGRIFGLREGGRSGGACGHHGGQNDCESRCKPVEFHRGSLLPLKSANDFMCSHMVRQLGFTPCFTLPT